MTYRLLVHAEFASQAQAQDAYDQIQARATNTRVAGMGGPGERTSYSRLDEVTEAGAQTALLAMWHVDTFGIVRDGEYVAPPRQYPLWIAPTGAQDSYPATNAAGSVTRVEHNGRVWRNAHGAGNSWEPGGTGIGETIWADEGPA